MSVETTISIKFENYDYLCLVAEKYAISKSRVITVIISMLSNKNSQFIHDRFSTAYQQKDKGNYRRLHIYLSEVVFNVALDLRHFSRSSLSLLIAEILENHYEELLQLLGGTDNYPHSIHCRIYVLDNDTISFKHYWGMPTEKDLEAG